MFLLCVCVCRFVESGWTFKGSLALKLELYCGVIYVRFFSIFRKAAIDLTMHVCVCVCMLCVYAFGLNRFYAPCIVRVLFRLQLHHNSGGEKIK